MDDLSMTRRVLVLGSFAPSLTKFRGPLLEAMVSGGHEVFAAAPAIDPTTAAELRDLGVEPVSIEISNSSLNPVSMWRTYRALRRLLRSLRPDVILSYTIKPVILGALAARAEGVKQVVSFITGLGYAFTGDKMTGRRRLVRQVASWLYKHAIARSDVILFQNPDDLATFRELGVLAEGANSTVVDGSGVDVEHYALAPLPDDVSFLMIARLLKDKGVREYAMAAKWMRRDHPEVRVALAGYLDPSPDSITIEELEAIKADGVEFLGRLNDVRPAIRRCSVYVLPSYREGTPRSVLEAMAMGRAIITTDAPGCRETVVDEVNGSLVPVGDAEALYRAMTKFVTHPSLSSRMGAESRKIAEHRYDARKVSADILRHIGL